MTLSMIVAATLLGGVASVLVKGSRFMKMERVVAALSSGAIPDATVAARAAPEAILGASASARSR